MKEEPNIIHSSQDMDREMSKENAIYPHSEIWFSLKTEGDPVICKNMDEPGRHYIKYISPPSSLPLPPAPQL